MSERTKIYTVGYWIFTVLSWLLVLGPLIGYMIYGFINAEVEEKATLGLTVIAAVFLSIISIVLKFHIRSTIFLVIIGIYVCVDNILPLIILISICTVVDEFIATPIKKMFQRKMTINREIDKRLT